MTSLFLLMDLAIEGYFIIPSSLQYFGEEKTSESMLHSTPSLGGSETWSVQGQGEKLMLVLMRSILLKEKTTFKKWTNTRFLAFLTLKNDN